MVFIKRKGYRVERKIRQRFEKVGWKVVRAGASLGEADLICIKNKKCILLQIKSTRKKTFYYYDYKESKLEGFPFYLVVDFGYGKIRILSPRQKTKITDGLDLKDFLRKI
jgi:Holliday junction resolvase